MFLLAEAVSMEGTPLWAQAVYAIVVALVGTLLVPYLNNKRKEAAAAIAALNARFATDQIEAGALLLEQVKMFLLERAACIAEKEFPKIAADVLAGNMDKERIKTALKGYGGDVKSEAIRYFKEQRGLDILAAVGDKQLDNLIALVANRVSPFPGKDSAVEFLKTTASNLLIEKGVGFVRHKYLSADPVEAPVAEAVAPDA